MNVYPNALIPADWDETETDSLKYINERERIKVSTHNPHVTEVPLVIRPAHPQ